MPKKISRSKLYTKALNKKRKQWESMLDKIAIHAVVLAEQGKLYFVIKQELLMNNYNDERTKEQIITDVRKRFPGCDCRYDFAITGQENIRVSWQKNT